MRKNIKRFLSILLVPTFILCMMGSFSVFVSAESTVVFSTDFEEKRPHNVFRTEVGHTTMVKELPGGREGTGEEILLDAGRSFFGIQPNGIGSTLMSYGTFNPGDTFTFHVDLYCDKEGTIELYPFVLLCINGTVDKEGREYEDYHAEQLNNYDEWYPSLGKGLTINEGSLSIPGKEWVTLDFTYTVSEGCSQKGRDIKFHSDAGAFYLYFTTSMVNQRAYIDNLQISMNTDIVPVTTTKAPVTTKAPEVSVDSSEEVSDDFLRGDANDDGVVDMKDVLLVRKYIAGMVNEINLQAADANRDLAVDMKDVLTLRKHLAGIALMQ